MNEKMCVLLEISQQANDLTLAEDMQTLFQWFWTEKILKHLERHVNSLVAKSLFYFNE